jgi:hypothetical protein
VELRRAQHPRRDRAGERGLLVSDLRGAVAPGKAIGADDRHDHDPLHAGALALALEVARRRGEELRGGVLVGRGPGGGVDDGLGADQGLGQALAGDDVHAARARDRGDLVALGLEDVHQVTPDPPGRAGDCDLLGCAHWCSSSLRCRCCHIGSISWVTGLTPGDEGM